MTWFQWFAAEWSQRFGELFGVGKLILAVERGRPFVANLRIEWLELQNTTRLPPVVQLLGDIDEIVSRSDNLDQFVTAGFVFIPLLRTNHANVIEFAGPDGAERRDRFVEALTLPVETLRARHKQPGSPEGYRPDPRVTRVVMIVHGIRDDGRWAADLGKHLQTADGSVRAFSRSYGYFSALYFLTPTRMEANVRWFVDQYTELLALYPKAEFHFIGHSNGTYMLAEALARYHGVKFGRVIFAGSVVQTGFGWSRLRGRVQAIRNFRASSDLVVAALPSVFEHVRGLRDVGGAGHAGFVDDFARATESRYFARGGHGAVLEHPENYRVLAAYILDRPGCTGAGDCDAYELEPAFRSSSQSVIANLIYRFCWLLWGGAILGIGAASYAASHLVRLNIPARGFWSRVARSAIAGVFVVGAVLTFLRYF